MVLDELDPSVVSAGLARTIERDEDSIDAYFEVTRECAADPERVPHLRTRCETGLALRFRRGSQSWTASADEITGPSFAAALRRVTRARSGPAFPRVELPTPTAPTGGSDDSVRSFEARVRAAVRSRHADLPFRLSVRSHHRSLRVVGPRWAPGVEREDWFSWRSMDGSVGGLLTSLDRDAVDQVAGMLLQSFRFRDAAAFEGGRVDVVLGPAAVAVLLHEVVAHVLEADATVLGPDLASWRGRRLGAESLDVLDDPSAAPPGIARQSDDEGTPVARRWLLRRGKVDQPLADLAAAERCEDLEAGAGRRVDRHHPVAPRSHHLELLGGEEDDDALLADAVLHIPSLRAGSLDEATGRAALSAAGGVRYEHGRRKGAVGPLVLAGSVEDLLGSISGIGANVERGGAGWCAKRGLLLPVWATAPRVRMENVEVRGV